MNESQFLGTTEKLISFVIVENENKLKLIWHYSIYKNLIIQIYIQYMLVFNRLKIHILNFDEIVKSNKFFTTNGTNIPLKLSMITLSS